jgi:23S rRNA maturation-related 3'-5' exoribonuclease YhaM
MSVGNFDYYNVEFFNRETLEQEIHKAESYDVLNQIMDLYYNHEKYQTVDWKMIKTGIKICSCGNTIECNNFTNTCRCGKDYNFSGSLLAPRSQWGEETGEHWTDCY